MLGLVVGVFAWWVAGLCSPFSCSRGCLRFLGVGVFAWGGGAWLPPPPLALAVLWWGGLLALTLWCGREKRVGEREGD